MGRGFLSGFVWGSIISALILGTTAALMPPPARPSGEDASAGQSVDQAPTAKAVETAPRAAIAEPTVSPQPAAVPVTPPPAPTVTPPPVPTVTPPPVSTDAPPPVPTVAPATEAPHPGADAAEPLPAEPATPTPAPKVEEPAPLQETQDLPETGDRMEPQAASPFERHPVPLTDRPDVHSTLPQVGTEPAGAGASAGTLAPDVHRLGQAPVAAGQSTPLVRNARPFSNPQGKPLMSVILIDDSAHGGLDPTGLAAMTVPITFAVDPMQPGAARTMARYADAGFEVVVLATGLPKGARAADLETTLGANLATIDRAVAVMDPQADGFSGNRELEQQALTMAAQEGYGLIGWGGGLGSLENAARRGEAPVALIYRAFDPRNGQTGDVARALDRAAFKATQDGSVIMAGHARPETVVSLLEWTRGSQASQVALAPVSAILTR